MQREYTVLSTDPKPINGVDMGSILVEVDTGNVFFFNESAGEWVEQFSLMDGGGGGNPNRVETITGTAANPWGDVDFNTFYNALRNNEANAYITLDVTALGYPTSITVYSNNAWDTGRVMWIAFTNANIQGGADDSAVYCSFGMDYVDEEPDYFIGAWLGGEVTIITDYASLVPTTLTIIWHPLPT